MVARASLAATWRPSAWKSPPPSKHRWTWQSTRPGVRVRPAPSTSCAARAARGARRWGPTHSMRPRPPAPRRGCAPYGRRTAGRPRSMSPLRAPAAGARPAEPRGPPERRRRRPVHRSRSPNSSSMRPASSDAVHRRSWSSDDTGCQPWYSSTSPPWIPNTCPVIPSARRRTGTPRAARRSPAPAGRTPPPAAADVAERLLRHAGPRARRDAFTRTPYRWSSIAAIYQKAAIPAFAAP